MTPVFSVGVRDKPKGPFFGVPLWHARRAFIVEAETDRKAKNAVARYLKFIGKDDVIDVVDAIPAEHLPAIARKTGLAAHRKRKTSPAEKPDAKFRRIAGEIGANKKWRRLLAGEYADEMKALDEIAKHYSGENLNTGGNVYVAVIPLGPHDVLGISAEVVCRYTNSKATSMEDVFWEPENDTSEGCISLVKTCACGAAMVNGVCSEAECHFNVQG